MKQVWALVGGNGAGKTSFHRLRFKGLDVPFINADRIAKDLYPEDPEGSSYDAAKVAESKRFKQITAGNSFCFETVFSHPSRIDFLKLAKMLGYQVNLIVIHLQQPELNVFRVSRRVAEGGHSVPSEKVRSRIPRMLANVRQAIPLCDTVEVYDNSSYFVPFRPVLSIRGRNIQKHLDPLPDWANDLIKP